MASRYSKNLKSKVELARKKLKVSGTDYQSNLKGSGSSKATESSYKRQTKRKER